MALVIVVPIIGIMIATFLNVGNSWNLKEDTLEIKAWPISESINLSSISVTLVEDSSSWKPVLRENGYGSPGLSSGWFKLENGNEAIVFKHSESSKILIVFSNERYYLIIHPGVEELYQELIIRGVKQGVM